MTDKPSSEDPRGTIIAALRSHPEGLTFKDIASIVGHHRHTVTKYVYELIGAQVILERDIGAAKLCYLRESYGKPAVKPGHERTDAKGQAQLAALFMLLLLLPASMIVAQNATVTGGQITGMVGGINLTEVMENGTLLPYQPAPSLPNATDMPPIEPESNITEPQIDTNLTESNSTPQLNETPVIEPNATDYFPEGNLTLNETIMPEGPNATEPNVTGIEGNDTGIELPEANVTIINLSLNLTGNLTYNQTLEENITTEAEPMLHLEIVAPEKVSRGHAFIIRAIIENRGGAAKRVALEWSLPQHFDMIQGDKTTKIGQMRENSTFTIEIGVTSRADSVLGKADVRARVSFE